MARALMPGKQKQYEQDKRQSEMQKANKRGDYYALTKPLWFKGTKYKSTLEATWAIYFEYTDIEYEYEPVTVTIEDGEPYTPDFYLKKSGIWIECKSPAAWKNNNKEIQRKIRGLTNIKNQKALIITAAPTYIDQGDIIEFKPNNKFVNRLEKIPTSCGGIVRNSKLLGRAVYQAKEEAKYKMSEEKERDAIKDDNSESELPNWILKGDNSDAIPFMNDIDVIKFITEQIKTHNRIPGTVKIDVSKVHKEKYYG